MAVKTGFPLNAVCCYTLPARDKKKNHFANYIEEKHHEDEKGMAHKAGYCGFYIF